MVDQREAVCTGMGMDGKLDEDSGIGSGSYGQSPTLDGDACLIWDRSPIP